MRHHLDDAPPLDSPQDNPSHSDKCAARASPHNSSGRCRRTCCRPAHPPRRSSGCFGATTGQGDRHAARLYSQIIRKIADGQANDVAANAWLFAGVNAAMGDAGILAWDDKYFYDVWRPVVGIREPEPSVGPTGVGGNVLEGLHRSRLAPARRAKHEQRRPEELYSELPAYPSGHTTFGATAFQPVRCSTTKASIAQTTS